VTEWSLFFVFNGYNYQKVVTFILIFCTGSVLPCWVILSTTSHHVQNMSISVPVLIPPSHTKRWKVGAGQSKSH
jgi:hypothetical protein